MWEAGACVHVSVTMRWGVFISNHHPGPEASQKRRQSLMQTRWDRLSDAKGGWG